jgi:ferrous iron transport protein A
MNGYAGSLTWWGRMVNLLAVETGRRPDVVARRPMVGRVTPCAPSDESQPTGRFTMLAAGRGLPALPGTFAHPVDQRAAKPAGKPVIEKLAGQPVGRKLKIVGFTLPADIYQRLLEMGLTKGTPCTVVRYAPMGDPIELKVRGYSLSLRLAEAAGVQVSCH